MKHSLQLKLSQHLTLTPQLQQSLRLLQLSTLELNQELERMLQDNPLLERDEDGDASGDQRAPIQNAQSALPRSAEEAPAGAPDSRDTEWFEEQASNFRFENDDSEYPQQAAETPSLREHLQSQLMLVNLSARDSKMVSLLIDNLNEEGYLASELQELAEMLPQELAVDPVELETALKHVQNLDPPGVGARCLGECLALQLHALPQDTPYREHALRIVRHHLDQLAARDYGALRRSLNCGEEELRAAQRLITSLDPRPGNKFGALEARYIIPDVVVKKIKGAWFASLNSDALPKLRINRMYADILQRHRENGSQLSSQLQEAKWLIKNVQQRFETILRVAQSIVDRQRRFFEHGEVAMRPLVLREIAETLGLHESTVSRVTTQKYMLTPRGIFEFKYFFGSHVATETGGACSATAIRALIKQMVHAENSKKPLSDSQIAEILGQQGIVVARRTIAKYRESLQIPPVNLRRAF